MQETLSCWGYGMEAAEAWLFSFRASKKRYMGIGVAQFWMGCRSGSIL